MDAISFCKSQGHDIINYDELLIAALINCQSNVDWTRYVRTSDAHNVYYRLPIKEDSEIGGMFDGEVL